jgi:type II secretory pathway pseudopilin PulG
MKYLIAAILIAVAAITWPNLHVAMERSDQKRTLADMRSIATAWEARATDCNTYVVTRDRNVSYEELRRALEPKYITQLPRTDGWGNPFLFQSTDEEYSIRAIGNDHRLDAKFVPGPTTDFARDIVYSNGTFTAYPEGL